VITSISNQITKKRIKNCSHHFSYICISSNIAISFPFRKQIFADYQSMRITWGNAMITTRNNSDNAIQQQYSRTTPMAFNNDDVTAVKADDKINGNSS